MSLLLDALNRASKDKAAAAAAQVPTVASTDGPNPDASHAGAQAQASSPALRSESADRPLAFELSLSDVVITAPPAAQQPDAWRDQQSAPILDKTPLLTPFVVSEAPPTAPVIAPPAATAPASVTPVATAAPPVAGNQPSAQQAPRVAQEIVRAKSPAARARPPLRVMVLGAVALLLAVALGSMLLGWWGDPSAWFQTSAIQRPVASGPGATARVEAVDAPAAAVTPPAPVAPDRPTPVAVVPAPVATHTATPAASATASGRPMTSSEPAPATVRPDQPMIQSRTAGPSALELGYAALVQGRLAAAAQAYGQALVANPEERDALLGLAYVAHQQGRLDEARGYYQRVLRQDPGNPVARAGLLASSAVDDAQTVASRAREIAEQNPDSAAAQSALGHAMVQEGRLADAQQAFLRAHALEPGVAQHAFNLAVALDRLHKFGQARLYYERALTLSAQSGGERASGVPQSVVQARLEQLRAANVASSVEGR